MKFLGKLAGLFLADPVVLAAVPLAALAGWLTAPLLAPAWRAMMVLALLSGAFSLGVLRAARKPPK